MGWVSVTMLASRSQSVFNIGELVKDLAKERRLLLDTNIPTELTLNLAVWLGRIILHRQHRCRLEPDRSKPPQFHGSVLAGEAVFDPPHIRERGVFVIRGRVIRCTGAPPSFRNWGPGPDRPISGTLSTPRMPAPIA